MNIQVQKEEIEETVAGLNLAPLVRLIGLIASGLPTDPGFWAERGERHAARASELRRRQKLERCRVVRLRDGGEPAAMTPADIKALTAADEVEATAVKGKRGAPSIRAQAGRMRSAVGEALIARAESRRAELRLEETVDLDAIREGEPADKVIEVRRGQGNKRLRTRDGLKLLHERGTFTPKDGRAAAMARIEADRLLGVGLRYRDRYEIAQSSVRSCLATPDRPPPSPNMFVQGRAAQRRAALANQVRVLDVAVSARLGAEALLALRMIAGEARTLRSITGSARRRERLAEGLTAALRVIGDMLDPRA